MATKMFSPKIEIINYFDELINQVDIDIDESIKKYNKHHIMADLNLNNLKAKCIKLKNRFNNYVKIIESTENDNDDENQTMDTVELWSESTKVVDYLNQVRMRTIDELRKEQEESLEYYKLNSSRFSYLKEIKDEDKIEVFKSQFFAEKFYFQIRLTSVDYKPLIFNLFTFVTDFYMSPSDIDVLQMLIINNLRKVTTFLRDSKPVLDDKMVLIALLARYFYDNLTTLTYPNIVISVTKRDILNIKEIKSSHLAKRVKLNCSLIDLSKLERLTLSHDNGSEEIGLDGLSSLKYLYLSLDSVERFSARNLPSLTHLNLSSKHFNNSISMQIFENLSNIKDLELNGVFSDINLDDLVNLEKLSISGEIDQDFNSGLFKNICNNLQELSINIRNLDDEIMSELFYGRNFPYLVKLDLMYSKITRLEKELFDRFPMLQSLSITYNNKLQEIDDDAFSSLTNLVYLDLRRNSIVDSINQKQFSKLISLKSLNLSYNKILFIEEKSFSNLKNLANLDLSANSLLTLNPKSFIGLANLKFLNLSSSVFRHFDLSIPDNFVNFEKINLTRSRITNRDEIRSKYDESKILL